MNQNFLFMLGKKLGRPTEFTVLSVYGLPTLFINRTGDVSTQNRPSVFFLLYSFGAYLKVMEIVSILLRAGSVRSRGRGLTPTGGP